MSRLTILVSAQVFDEDHGWHDLRGDDVPPKVAAELKRRTARVSAEEIAALMQRVSTAPVVLQKQTDSDTYTCPICAGYSNRAPSMVLMHMTVKKLHPLLADWSGRRVEFRCVNANTTTMGAIGTKKVLQAV